MCDDTNDINFDAFSVNWQYCIVIVLFGIVLKCRIMMTGVAILWILSNIYDVTVTTAPPPDCKYCSLGRAKLFSTFFCKVTWRYCQAWVISLVNLRAKKIGQSFHLLVYMYLLTMSHYQHLRSYFLSLQDIRSSYHLSPRAWHWSALTHLWQLC